MEKDIAPYSDILAEAKMELLEDKVIPGQLLAVKKPPAFGNSGLTVTGVELSPQMGQDVPIILGKNTYASEDGLRIYAATLGKVTWKGNRVSVEKELEIDKDIEEDINFDGQIKILGNVNKKIKIQAEGEITISGRVMAAEIKSGGSIEIKQEIKNATIIAGEDIVAPSAKESSLEAKGNILIEGALINCQVKGYSVICSGRKGIIQGGSVLAKKEINAMAIGSERASSQTEVKIQLGGSLSVQGTLYPKVKMMLGRRSMIVKRPLKRITFKADLTGTTTTEYQKPNLEALPMCQEEESKQKKEKPKLPPSVVIYALSLEEAKKKGAELLALPLVEVDGRIISEEENNLIKWRIFQKGSTIHWQEEWEDMKSPVKEGCFEIENRPDGLYLHITPPAGTDEIIKPEDVFTEIRRQDFRGIDSSKVIEACKSKVKTTVKIGMMQLTEEIGGKIKIDLSEDKLKTYLTIIPPKMGDLMIGPEDVLSALKGKGIIVGIKKDVIVGVFKNKEFEKPILVAEAILPQAGQKAYLQYRIGTTK